MYITKSRQASNSYKTVFSNIINLRSLKQSSDRLVIIAKGFVKLSYLLILIKQKIISSQKLDSGRFDKLLIVFPNVNLLYLLFLMFLTCFLLHLIRQNCLMKSFLRTYIIMNQVSLYLLSSLEPNCNCIIFLWLPEGHNWPWFLKGVWSS